MKVFPKIIVNQESGVCATPRIDMAVTCNKLPAAIVGFCDSWLTFVSRFLARQGGFQWI